MNNQIELISQYIEEKHLPLQKVDVSTYKDNLDKTYLIVEEKNGLLFDENFSLILSEDEKEQEVDYYMFNFGGLPLYVDSKKAKEPKLNILRYVGTSISDLQEKSGFVHLGVHGVNELLNGCQKYEYWCLKAKYLGIKTLGICERNTLGSAFKFQNICEKQGVGYVLGSEVVILKDKKKYIFKLFCKNDTGWTNLINIINIIRCFGEYEGEPAVYERYINEEDLLEHLEGLIVVFPNDYPFSEDTLGWYEGIDKYYQIDTIEYLDDTIYYKYLSNIKDYLEDWSGEIPPVLLGDAYYLDEEDKQLQEVVNKIDKRLEFRYATKSQHFKSIDEHTGIFKKFWKGKEDLFEYIWEAAINSTKEIAEKCQNFKIERHGLHLPAAKIDGVKEEDNLDFLNQLIDKGMEEHGFRGNPKYEARLEEEYRTIVGADLENYFLILWDIVQHCKKVGNYTGYGRGSACGSLITYLIGITKLDPFDYDLLFSRFLNAGRVATVVYDIYLNGKLREEYTGIHKLDCPLNCDKQSFKLKIGEIINGEKVTKLEKRYEGHVSMPDIDLDIENREEVKQYLISKYGRERFTVIGSYNTFKIKAGVKDLSREVGTNMDYAALNAMTNTLFFKEGKDAYFEEVFKAAQENSFFKNFVLQNPKIIRYLFWLLDTPKSTSIHPCACMLIPDDEKDIFDYFPMFEQKGEFVCEWEGAEVEAEGFLKEDLLGLQALEFLHNICNLIKENKGIDLDVFHVPLDDKEVFRYFQNGYNSEVFQLNSNLLVNFCKLLKPSEMNDLIASIALVRPGPLNNGLHIKYQKRKQGLEKPEYKFGFELATKDTYGILVYQEQIIKLCSYLGDLTLVEADDVRKSLGKKLMDKLQLYHDKIKPNAIKKGCSEKEFEEIWTTIQEFAKYSFNRSHSAAYAVTGYITQWLKVNYPIEFWTAAFEKANNSDKRKEKFNQYFKEIAQAKIDIQVVNPDINTASNKTTNDNKTHIYFPLNNIKYLSNDGVENILAERKRNGKFYSFEEFLIRLGKDKLLDKREFTNLILSGVFDEVEDIQNSSDRKKLIIKLYNYLKKDYREFFLDPFQQNEVWWDLKQWELLGVANIQYKKLLRQNKLERYSYFGAFKELSSEQKVSLGGIILDYSVKKTKKKQEFGEIFIENNNIPYTIIFWPEVWEQYKEQVEKYKGYLILMEGVYGENSVTGNGNFTLIEDSIPIFIGSDGQLLEKPKPISFSKFDKVQLADGAIGTVIKYPSNQAITLELKNKKQIVVTKFDIKEVVEKFNRN